jgi:hypothetical protein
VRKESLHGGDGVHDDGAVGSFAGGADNFLMVPMADENDGALFAGEFQRFQVNFGHEGASGVNDFQCARLGFVANRRGHSVSAENQHGAVGHLFDGFHKNRTAAAQLLYHVGVVDDFVMHVDWCAVSFQRQFDDVYRANDSGAETPRTNPQ